MGYIKQNLKNSAQVKLEIGSPEHQIKEELSRKIETVEKLLADIKDAFDEYFG